MTSGDLLAVMGAIFVAGFGLRLWTERGWDSDVFLCFLAAFLLGYWGLGFVD